MASADLNTRTLGEVCSGSQSDVKHPKTHVLSASDSGPSAAVLGYSRSGQ